MLKRFDEAIKKELSDPKIPDCSKGCNVFKILKDMDYDYYDDYGERTREPKGYFKRKSRKVEEPEVSEYHKLHLFSEGLSSKDTQYDYTKDVEEKEKQDAEERDRDSGHLEGTSTAREPVRETTGDGGPEQQTGTVGEQPVQDTTAGKQQKYSTTTGKQQKDSTTAGKQQKDTTTTGKRQKDSTTAGKQLQDTVTAGTQSQDTTTADKQPQDTITAGKRPQETTTAGKEPQDTTTADKTGADGEPETDNADNELELMEMYARDKFRDRIRRIDMVLVAIDSEEISNDFRITYLQNILKTGLQIETSPGVMPMHRNLMFIKIHAPDTILDEYNYAMGTKKYFRDEHLRFVRPGLSCYGRLLPCTRVSHEREMISLVRDQYEDPLRLSNEERSLIVYKILLQMPFGDSSNMIGLNGLLDRKILLDAFALHDGPYFITRNQESNTITARQMLFYNWVGKINAHKVHPLNLIREYFGQRVGMFFAFYEFYNHALIIAALGGVIYYFMALNDTTDSYIVDDICKDKKNYMCPRCIIFEACRFSNLSNFCKLAKIHRVLDGPMVLYYAIFMVMWATTFSELWKRKEKFWIWLWEINTSPAHETYRPEYSLDYTVHPRSRRTGLPDNYVTGFEKHGRALVVAVTCIAVYASPLLALIPLFEHKQRTDINLIADKVVSLPNEDIAFIVIFAIKLVFVQIIGELIYRLPVYLITEFLENHRTAESYARSFAIKTFLAAFVWTFPILFYYAWLKGFEYFLPIRVLSLAKRNLFVQRRGRYTFTHCGPFTCLDEVFFVLLATILIRHIAIPFLVYLKGLIYNTRTDYNQYSLITKNAPCWEREYLLEPVTETMMTRKLTVLMMQIALMTLVGVTCPFAPLLVLIRNFCDIRYEARMFLQCRRRPLLLGTALGVWTPILQRLTFLSIPSIALTLARTTKVAPRIMYMLKMGSMKGFLFYSMYEFPTEAYILFDETWPLKPPVKPNFFFYESESTYKFDPTFKPIKPKAPKMLYKGFVPATCYTPGYFWAPNRFGYESQIFIGYGSNNLKLNPEYYRVSSGRYILYTIFSISGLLYAAALYVALPLYNTEVNQIMDIESRLKKAYLRMSKRSDKAA